MAAPPYAYPPPRNPDLEHIRLLTIFHYVAAALEALFGLIGLIYVAMGIGMVTGKWPPTPAATPMDDFVGWMFVAIGGLMMVFVETLAVLTFFAGRALSRHRRRMFCLVVAGLNCLHMPIGTALGVFTLIVLLRPSVKALFDSQPEV
jgi:hypothetical protein